MVDLEDNLAPQPSGQGARESGTGAKGDPAGDAVTKTAPGDVGATSKPPTAGPSEPPDETPAAATASPPDPFDPGRLRLSQDFAASLGVKKALLTPREVDQLLRYPRGRSAKLARTGKLPAVLLPDNEIRFHPRTIEDLVSRWRISADGASAEGK